MVEIHGNIVAADVGGHGDDGRVVELSNEMAGGNAVQVRHDDVHQHQIILRSRIHFVHGLETVKLARVSARPRATTAGPLTALSMEQWTE